MKEVKWFVWTDTPRPDEPPEICKSLEEVFEFLEEFEANFGFKVPTQTIMLRRICYETKTKE